MKKIIWKNLLSNIRSFLVFFLSIILSVSVLFVLIYIQEVSKNITVVREIMRNGANAVFQRMNSVIPFVIVITVLVIVYAVRFYIQSRMKDYGLLMILGIRSKEMRLFLIAEYGAGCLLAFAAGFAAGRCLTWMIGRGLERQAGKNLTESINMTSMYKLTAVLCIGILLLSLLVIFFILSEKNLSEVTEQRKKKERIFAGRKSWIFAAAGCVLILGSVLLNAYYYNVEIKSIFLTGTGIGLAMILLIGTGGMCEKFRKTPGYYKQIIPVSQYYYRINSSNLIIYIQVMLGIVLLLSVFQDVRYSFPIEQRKYVNDFLVVYSSEEPFFEEFNKRFPGENQEFSVVWLHDYEREPRIGISVSQYNRAFHQQETLRDDELISLVESKAKRSMIEDKKNMRTPPLAYTDSCWKKDGTYNMDNARHFDLKYEKYETIIGFEATAMGGICIFSDKTFAELRDLDKTYQNVAMLNIDDKNWKEAKEYIERFEGINHLYDRKTELQREREENLLKLYMAGIVGIALLSFSMFVIWLRLFSDMEMLKEKYRFLLLMGMREKERKRCIKKEMGMPLWVQLGITAVLFAGLGTGQIETRSAYETAGRMMEKSWYYKEMLFMLAGYVVLEICLIKLIRCWMIKRVWEE